MHFAQVTAMRENDFYSEEFPQHPEYSAIPEHSALPEYNPVYPDASFFRESSVTCREENVFQGRPPAGEPPRRNRRQKRKEQERYSLLQALLGSAARGGAAVLCGVAAVALITADTDTATGGYAAQIAEAFRSAQRPAFTQQMGYETDEFVRLWNGDPEAPHQYDMENPLISVPPTCTENGEVEYVCLECGVHLFGVLPAAGHQPDEPERYDEIAATCETEGEYTEIVLCSVCGEKLTEQTVSVAATGHTPGQAEHTDETDATCTEKGRYTEIVTCSVCGKEISRTVVTTAALGHTASSAVRENETEASCTAAGRYEETVYCSVCGEEISRTVRRTAALGHSASSAVRENEAEATCTEAGGYDNVVYCSRCGEEISRTTVTTAATGHTAGETVQENAAVEDCTQGGTCEEVVYCSVCGEEISRTESTVAPTDHTAGSTEQVWVHGHEDASGNITGADCLDGGAYQEVTYCSVCGQEMARSEEIEVEPTGHVYSMSPASGTVLACSQCGARFLDAEIGNAYVYYSVDTDYLDARDEWDITGDTVRLWSYSAGEYVDYGGYEFGSSGSSMIPEEYRNPGERFRIDWYFSDGSYVSSNDVTYE